MQICLFPWFRDMAQRQPAPGAAQIQRDKYLVENVACLRICVR
jgi:hypothetical protein